MMNSGSFASVIETISKPVLLSLCLILMSPTSTQADAHNWLISEIFSSADGTVQFVEFTNEDDDEQFMSAENLQNNAGQTYNFPADLPTSFTANRRLLVGTAAYAALPGAPAPDYIIPSGLFLVNGDAVIYSGGDEVVFSSLPTNGILSINPDGIASVNSPTNFAGVSGSITVTTSAPDCNANGIPDSTDIASGTSTDCDFDGVPDECTAALNDCNNNGIHDACEIDGDGDGIIDACDACPNDINNDSDGDGVCDSQDICAGGNDFVDSDLDGIPDFCDACPLDAQDDSDGDGVCDSEDICPGGDDTLDTDLDGNSRFLRQLPPGCSRRCRWRWALCRC